MRNAHAGFMSNQLMLETSDVGKRTKWLETDILNKAHAGQYVKPAMLETFDVGKPTY